ncbi:LOW QUALITY PROTEIN: C-C chemokine receptor type 5-like [Amphiprion ocellaris]|uniref:LOW QUALITY PROTEIN: C-C chemokine receptor type 5-like n=1 Tax=Amphiprion ocellaris TaxID=80972 RepID=UPI002410BACF|nr:LOW QUALITY PROTEIN: C-C chemokine receptor type 5-like [Amphiprion ocellaris]
MLLDTRGMQELYTCSADPAARFHLLCPPVSCTLDPALTRPPPRCLPHLGPAACSWNPCSSWRVSACRTPPSALENTPSVAPPGTRPSCPLSAAPPHGERQPGHRFLLSAGVYQLGFCSGTLFVTLMSVDRYLAIVHAVAAIQARTLRYGITASVITWVISVIMATPQVVFASLEMDGDDSHCHPIYPEDNQYFWKMQQNFSKNTVGLFVCLPIIVFCYVKILVVLSKCRNSKKNRAVKLIFTIVCVFVVCWVPYNVLVFLQTLEQLGVLNNCNVSKAISSAMGFAEIIALSHCCINPVVYAFVRENFRKSLARVLSCP